VCDTTKEKENLTWNWSTWKSTAGGDRTMASFLGCLSSLLCCTHVCMWVLAIGAVSCTTRDRLDNAAHSHTHTHLPVYTRTNRYIFTWTASNPPDDGCSFSPNDECEPFLSNCDVRSDMLLLPLESRFRSSCSPESGPPRPARQHTGLLVYLLDLPLLRILILPCDNNTRSHR
jgi:hypothetical protein